MKIILTGKEVESFKGLFNASKKITLKITNLIAIEAEAYDEVVTEDDYDEGLNEMLKDESFKKIATFKDDFKEININTDLIELINNYSVKVIEKFGDLITSLVLPIKTIITSIMKFSDDIDEDIEELTDEIYKIMGTDETKEENEKEVDNEAEQE